MLLVSGLLTLLAIAHAGGYHIKGGSHSIKGVASAIAQEAVAQEDIVPSAHDFNTKRGGPWGQKLTREETGDPDDHAKGSSGFVKTSEPNTKQPSATSPHTKASAPALHHAVKTIPEDHGKFHSAPGLHHAASVPVTQSQVTVDDPTADDDSGRGIKSLQAATSGKTRFYSQDIPLREPIARPVTKSVKTIKDSSRDSSQGVKSATPRPRQSTSQDVRGRDPTARPIIKTIKTVKDPAASVASISTQSSIKSIKVADQKYIKSTDDSSNSNVGTSPRKTDYIRTATTPQSVAARRRPSLGTSSYDSERTSSRDRDAVRQVSALGPQQVGLRIPNENGEIILNEATLNALQSIDGVINEKGEIILNEEAMQLIQKMGGNISGQRPTVYQSPFNRENKETTSSDQDKLQMKKPFLMRNTEKLRKPGTGNRVRTSQSTEGLVSGRIDTNYLTSVRKPAAGTFQRTATGSQGAFANRETGQSVFSPQSDTVLFNGKEIRLDGLKEGQLFDENLKPILSANAGSVRQGVGVSGASQGVKPGSRTRVTQNVASLSRTTAAQGSAGIVQRGISQQIRLRQQGATLAGGRLTSPQATRDSVTGRVDNRYLTITRNPVSGSSQITAPGSQSAFANRQTGQSIFSSQSGTVLFGGKEILLDGLKEGQLFDENLKPILSSDTGSFQQGVGVSSTSEGVKPVNRVRVTQNVDNLSRINAVQGGIREQGRTSQQGAIISGGRLTSSQPTEGFVSGRVDTSYLTSARKPTSGAIQTTTTGSQSAFANKQTGQSVFSSQSDTVLFNGKEIRLDGLEEGQLFDENLKPILSANARTIVRGTGVSPISQGVKPATRTRVTQNVASLLRTTAVQGSAGILQGGISQQARTRQQDATLVGGHLTSSQATRGSVSGRVDSRYLTSVRKPVSGTSQTTATSSQKAFANRQTGQSIYSSQPDTVLFDGKEIRLDGLKAGQLFDENLKPILTAEAESARLGAGASGASQGVKPASRSRLTQNVVTLSRTSTVQGSTGILQGGISHQARTRQQGATLVGGHLTSSQATRGSVSGREDSRYLTSVRTPVSGTSQTTATSSQKAFANRQTGQSIYSSQPNTVLFNGKEIRLDSIKEGQLFDENLKPILSTNAGSVRHGASVSGASQGVKPVSRTTLTQNVASLSRASTVQGTAGIVQSEISQQIRSRQQGATLTGGRLTSSQATRGSVSGSVDSRYLINARKPVSGTSQTIATSSQNAFSNRQTGQSVYLSQPNTVLFDGKEIILDDVKEGQLFDENLKPILSANAGSVRHGAGVSGASQGVKPASRTRVTQNVASLSRTSTVQGSAGIAESGISQQTRSGQQGAPLTSGRLTSSQATRGSVTGRVDSRYLTSVRKPVTGTYQTTATGREFANRQTGQSVSPSSDVVLFNGKEIRLDGIKEGQLFDENLKPILLTNVGNVRQETGVSVRSEVVKPASRSRNTENAASFDRLGVSQTSRGNILGGLPSMYNIPQRENVQEISQDEIEPKVIQQKIDSGHDELQKLIQETFIDLPEGGSVKAPVTEFSQKALDPLEFKQTQLKVDDVLEQRSLSVPDSSKKIQIQERVPIAIAKFTASPENLSKTTIAKVSQVKQEDIDDPTIQQQTSDDIPVYAPEASFSPPFNYGIPRIPTLNSSLRTSTVHEQKKVEQVFV